MDKTTREQKYTLSLDRPSYVYLSELKITMLSGRNITMASDVVIFVPKEFEKTRIVVL